MRAIRGADIAMIFQEPMTSLNPVFTVGDQIAEAIACTRARAAPPRAPRRCACSSWCAFPKRGACSTRYPHQLSGGMRQRVMIAMALSCQPALLIADEPTTALDVTIQAQILQLIRELQDEMNMGVIFITHDMGVVAEVADRVLVMYRGEKVEEGASDAVFAAPAHPYTRALLVGGAASSARCSGTDLAGQVSAAAVDSSRAAPPPCVAPPSPQDTAAAPMPPPILRVRDLVTRFDVSERPVRPRDAPRACGGAGQLRPARPARRWRWSANRAAASRPPGRSLLRLVESQSGAIEFDGREHQLS